MKIEDIMEKLKVIFTKIFDEDVNFTASTSAKDVESWDSLSNIRFMLAVERVFGIKFSADEMANFENVGDLASSIATRA